MITTHSLYYRRFGSAQYMHYHVINPESIDAIDKSIDGKDVCFIHIGERWVLQH